MGCPKLASKHFDPDACLAHAYLPRDEAMAPLAERAAQLIALRKLFRESVPKDFSDVCKVANLRRTIGKDSGNSHGGQHQSQDTVVILAPNSAAAAKLKSQEVASWAEAEHQRLQADVNALNAETVRAMKLPDLRERLASQGADPVTSTPEQFAAYVKEELGKWSGVVKASGMKVD